MPTYLDRRSRSLAMPAVLEPPAFLPHYLAGLIFAVLDFSLVVSSFVAAEVLFHGILTDGFVRPWPAALLGAQAGLLTVGVIAVTRGYGTASLQRLVPGALGFLQAWIASFFVIGWIAFLTQSMTEASRGTVTTAFIVGIAAALPLRMAALAAFEARVAQMRLATRRVILIHDGDDESAGRFRSELSRHGVHAPVAFSCHSGPDRRLVEQCRAVLAARKLEAVYLFIPWSDVPRFRSLRSELRRLPVPVFLFPDDHAAEVLRGKRVDAGFASGYEIQRAPLDALDQVQKRLLDIVVSATMLFLLAPLFAVVAAAIRMDSSGPIFFRQTRKGFSGRPFQILKFRSMRVTEDGPVVRQATRDDDRTTPIGRFLRASSIDELPQLLNVLKGDMSLVGPRPHAVAHDEHYAPLIATYAHRHHVKPGLTGWAQVNGHRGATPQVDDMEARVRHDLWYIDNWSLWLDVRIILKTAIVVLRDRNAY